MENFLHDLKSYEYRKYMQSPMLRSFIDPKLPPSVNKEALKVSRRQRDFMSNTNQFSIYFDRSVQRYPR